MLEEEEEQQQQQRHIIILRFCNMDASQFVSAFSAATQTLNFSQLIWLLRR
jgi:hypothetical protein